MAGAGGGEDGGKDLMSPAEMKPLLVQSKRKPVSCAVGMTKDKQGVLLLDRKVKPRKLMAELKSRAKSEGVDLDMVSVRFGRVAVGTDDGTAVFTLNKAAPAALRMKLVEKLRPAGVRKVELGVDEGLEDEGDEEAEDGGTAAAGHGAGRGEAGAGAGQDTAGAGGGGRGGAGDGAGGGAGGEGAGTGQAAGPGRQAQAGPGGPDVGGPGTGDHGTGDHGTGDPGTGSDAAPGPGAGRGAPDKAAVTRRLAELVKRMIAALPVNPPNAAEMKAAASAGYKAVQSGDLAAASQAADTLERLLGETDGGDETDPTAPRAPGAVNGSTMPVAAPGAGEAHDGAAASAADNTTGTVGSPGGGTVAPLGTFPTTNGASLAEAGSEAPALAPGLARRGPSDPLLAKAAQAWRATRAKVQSEITAAVKEATSHHGQDSDEGEVVRKAFESVLRKLDDRLAAKLEQAVKASDGAAHAKLVSEAQGTIKEYQTFIDGSPLVAELDKNPYHPVTVRKTMDAALAVLSKAVQGGGGRAAADVQG